MAIWRSDAAASSAAVLCLACVAGVMVAVAVKVARSRASVNDDENDSKPQTKFKRVLADNSQTSFVHLGQLDKGLEDVHPFGEEIRALVENPVVSFSEVDFSSNMDERFIWIETREELQSLAETLSKETEFAVDTEQHSIRSFLGFTALIQVSTYKHDYLVDSIALHDDLDILRPVFADSSICKVFHGADSDILWLQRDFHIYVVNLFDTARACDVLGKPQRSLAYLLQTYCDVSTNKIFQKADWRQRPLPEDMLLYARIDAHYLLYIARRLYAELLQGQTAQNAPFLELAMRRSHLMCLQLYEKDGLNVSGATTAESLLSRFYQDKPNFSCQVQETTFRKRVKILCEWRDSVARSEDESLRFVLSDAALLAVAKSNRLIPEIIYSAIKVVDSTSRVWTTLSMGQLLPSPSPLVKKHINILITLLRDATDSTSVVDPVINRGGKAANGLNTVVPFRKGRSFQASKLSKSDYAEFKRMQFVKKFSCKGLVYENCRIYAGDGRLLCYCDRKKLEWYLQRGLAETVNEDPPAIRLCFEPKGCPEDENNEFYVQSKSNQCVSCGETSHYLRYRIIPSCYRQHFPEYLKSHRSHDIVLLCVDCHETAHRAAEKYKHVIAAEHGIPLFARKVVDAGGEDEAGVSAIESEAGVSPLQLRNAAMALLCHGPDMPDSRREELEMVISAYFGGREIDYEDMKAAALVGIDPRGQKRLSKKIGKVLRSKKQVGAKRSSKDKFGANSQIATTKVRAHQVEALSESLDTSKKSKISLLGHGLHGKRVVERIWTEQGEEGIRNFIKKWRTVFVEALHPAFLPSGWEVAHSGHREFGDYSVYKPKWRDGV